MAFPTVAASTTSTEGSNTTSHTVSLPTGISAGDRLGVLFTNHGTATVTTPSGWSEIDTVSVDDGSADNCRTTYLERFADGNEGSTLSITTSASERSTHIAMRFESSDGSQAAEATTNSGTGNNPDPPSLTPSWGSDDTKWLACFGHHFNDADEPSDDAPTNYSVVQTIQGTGSSNFDTTSGVADRDLAATSEDPGTWTITGLDVWVSMTVAIPPVLTAAGADIEVIGHYYRSLLQGA